nr:MAG TPA: hypothetical protein [Caudoviricetes sp.]
MPSLEYIFTLVYVRLELILINCVGYSWRYYILHSSFNLYSLKCQ